MCPFLWLCESSAVTLVFLNVVISSEAGTHCSTLCPKPDVHYPRGVVKDASLWEKLLSTPPYPHPTFRNEPLSSRPLLTLRHQEALNQWVCTKVTCRQASRGGLFGLHVTEKSSSSIITIVIITPDSWLLWKWPEDLVTGPVLPQTENWRCPSGGCVLTRSCPCYLPATAGL